MQAHTRTFALTMCARAAVPGQLTAEFTHMQEKHNACTRGGLQAARGVLCQLTAAALLIGVHQQPELAPPEDCMATQLWHSQAQVCISQGF